MSEFDDWSDDELSLFCEVISLTRSTKTEESKDIIESIKSLEKFRSVLLNFNLNKLDVLFNKIIDVIDKRINKK